MSNKTIYIMGVSGCGKSTIGQLLSQKTGIPFFDGDDFHPKKNIEKMASGHPLTDDDRRGWLESLNHLAKKESEKKGAIIACSALKKSYRDILKNGFKENVFFIFLTGTFSTIKKRLEQRGGHFMPAELLQSQFDDLQTPAEALLCDIEKEPEEIVRVILNELPFNPDI